MRDLSKEDEEDDLAGKDEEREATDGDADESGLPPSAPGGGQEGENPKHEAKDGRACAANDCEREWHGDQAPNPEDDGEDRPEPGCEAVARPHVDPCFRSGASRNPAEQRVALLIVPTYWAPSIRRPKTAERRA